METEPTLTKGELLCAMHYAGLPASQRNGDMALLELGIDGAGNPDEILHRLNTLTGTRREAVLEMMMYALATQKSSSSSRGGKFSGF